MHIMIDVETLGTRPGSVVTQIGAVAFDDRGFVDAGLGINMDPQDQIDYGLKVDWSTIKWWMQQEEAARKTLMAGGLPINIGMAMVQNYIQRWGQPSGVWANGQDFDLPLVSNLFGLAGIAVPWQYNKGRDLRTLAATVERLGMYPNRPEPAVPHNALSDAQAQARWIQALWASLPGGIANGSPTVAATLGA